MDVTGLQSDKCKKQALKGLDRHDRMCRPTPKFYYETPSRVLITSAKISGLYDYPYPPSKVAVTELGASSLANNNYITCILRG